MRMTRRRAVTGLGAAALAAGSGAAGARRLPLHAWYDELTGACGPSGPSPPRRPGTRVVSGTLRSASVPEPVDWAVGLPPGQAGPAAAVCLPGRGSDAGWVMNVLHAVDFVAAAGLRYAVAAVDGGESYWHRRADGEDRMRMLIDDFLPLLRTRFGLDPRAVMGWSMGGCGALLAGERHPGQFRAVAVSSAAIWPTHAQQRSAVPDAFDGAADFTRNDVFAGARRLAGTAVSISCGTADPFIGGDRAFAARVPRRPAGEFTAGCHDADFWRRMLPAQVRFVGRALAAA
ncbi:MAG TPA: alpha/beta fold hydrolase [Gaiellales bacterium]|nr:alpha/beta fold hydrolase [Gaiellales bacterium]